MRNIKLSLVFWVFCCFVIMTPSFLSIFKHHQLSMTVDTRTLLREWLLKNIGSADRFLYSLDTFIPPKDFPDQSIAIDGGLFDVRTGHVSTLKPLREYKRDGFDYIILDEWHEQVALDAFLYNPKRKDISDRYRVFRNEINETAELVAEFTPYYNTSDRFDLENVDFLSTGLWQRKSMGPRIRVYKL